MSSEIPPPTSGRARSPDNVVRLITPRNPTPPGDVRPARFPWITKLPLFLAAALVGSIPFASIFYYYSGIATYVNNSNEPQRISLPTGSTLVLNGHSALAFWRQGLAFHAELRRGESVFKTRGIISGNLTVHAYDTDIRDLGTAFSVRLGPLPGQVEVALARGRVTLSRPQTRDVLLQPNQQATLSRSQPGLLEPQITVIAPESLRAEWSWSDEIIGGFDCGLPLSFIAERINRRGEDKVVLVGAHLASLRISSKINLDNPEGSLYLLSNLTRITVSQTKRGEGSLYTLAEPKDFDLENVTSQRSRHICPELSDK
jgi:ferric-dicitrate binding protein FerR (iron transport regulator)